MKKFICSLFVCCSFFGYESASYAQEVRPEFSVNIHEFTDNEGRPHYTWTLGRLTWTNYDQQEAWRENPNMRLNVYIMPVGVMWHGGSSYGPSLMADIGTRFTRHIYSGIQNLEGTNGFYSSLKAGLEYNRINLTAGYSFIKLPSGLVGNLQVHFGLRIGQ